MINGDTPIPRSVAVFLIRLEKYALPLLDAILARQQFRIVWAHLHNSAGYTVTTLHFSRPKSVFAVVLVRHVLLLILMVFSGCMLAFSRSPTVLPDKLKHILLPLAMSFYVILYPLVDNLPLFLRQDLLPIEYQIQTSLLGVILTIFGYSLILWAILYLRRAFGLFVSVKGVVLGGPYAYVRHPIYVGYFLDALGLLALTCSPAMIVLVAGFFALLVCRARVEEETLSAASSEYAQHRLKTGFLFPRWR